MGCGCGLSVARRSPLDLGEQHGCVVGAGLVLVGSEPDRVWHNFVDDVGVGDAVVINPIVRDEHGEYLVLEDNLRSPSGTSCPWVAPTT